MNSSKIDRSKVLQLAHLIKNTGISFGEAQRQAWEAMRVKRLLSQSIVELTFKKSGGELTKRIATLQTDYLPIPKISSKPRKRISSKITFWSLSDNGFRSFLPSNLISYQVSETVRLAA